MLPKESPTITMALLSLCSRTLIQVTLLALLMWLISNYKVELS
jgi:hypothetical protein